MIDLNRDIDPNTAWYVDYTALELKRLRGGKFTGNVEIKFNFKDGNLTHINCVLNKSVKLIKK